MAELTLDVIVRPRRQADYSYMLVSAAALAEPQLVRVDVDIISAVDDQSGTDHANVNREPNDRLA